MTCVTLKIQSRSPSLNVVFACSGAKFGEYMSNISSDIERKQSSYGISLNDICDLENKINVTQFELGLRLAPVLLCTKFGEVTSNISPDISWKPSCMARPT